MSDKIYGFSPVFDEHSRVLILGSFPSVQSRKVDFYYGNKQNRFWPMLGRYFGESVGEGGEARRAFVLRQGVALWDIVVACHIRGSSDASIRDSEIADLDIVLRAAPVERILLNGATAYNLFCERYAAIGIPYRKMPSTSPANPRYREEEWFAALDAVFARGTSE